MLINIRAAGFRQGRIIAVVVDLHLDEVEHLVLAGLGGQLVLVLRQAAQHLAPAGPVGRALLPAQPFDVQLAGLVQAEVKPAMTNVSASVGAWPTSSRWLPLQLPGTSPWSARTLLPALTDCHADDMNRRYSIHSA